jgi:predicted transcriptional regulator
MGKNSNSTPKLSPKQNRVIIFLLAGHTQQEAAKLTGVGKSTVTRWLDQTDFSDALMEGQERTRREAEGLLSGALSKAVQALVSVLESDEASPVVKVNAARAVLDYSLKFKAAGELEDRIVRLEEQIDK